MTDTAAVARGAQLELSEDWLAVIIGIAIFALSLVGAAGPDLLGWVVTTAVWTDPGKALAPFSKAYAALGGFGSLVVTYAALLAVLGAAAVALKIDIRRFAVAFTVVFLLAYGSWIVGSQASLAVTAVGKLNLATSLLWRGVVAIIEAYLIYGAVVYFVARKWFGFSREWAAPLARGPSCPCWCRPWWSSSPWWKC